jgi:hypothetical protein
VVTKTAGGQGKSGTALVLMLDGALQPEQVILMENDLREHEVSATVPGA